MWSVELILKKEVEETITYNYNNISVAEKQFNIIFCDLNKNKQNFNIIIYLKENDLILKRRNIEGLMEN